VATVDAALSFDVPDDPEGVGLQHLLRTLTASLGLGGRQMAGNAEVGATRTSRSHQGRQHPYGAGAGRRGSDEVVLCADGDGAEPALTSWLTWSRDLDALGHD
jgi:hypothetical protein